MVEIYGQQINQMEDLIDISDLLAKDADFQKGLNNYISNKYNSDDLNQFIPDGQKVSMAFNYKGDTIYLVGHKDKDTLDESHLNALLKAIEEDLVINVHYISSNGLFMSLVESCAPNSLGFDITGDAEIEDKEFLFGHSKYIAIVTVNDEQENELVDFLFNNNVPVTLLGHVTKGELRLDELSFGHITDYVAAM